MYQNYMDYTNDGCMNIFTNDQKSRVMAVLQISPRRKGLLTSNVYIGISIPKAKFALSNTSICKNSSVTFTDKSTKQPTSWAWNVYDSKDAIVTTSGSNAFVYTFQNTGNYSVKLIVANQFGSDTLLYKNCLQVISDNQTTMPYLESFEGTTVLGNWVYYNPKGDTIWKVNNQVSAYGIGSNSVFYNNYDSTYDKTGIKNGIISPKFNMQTSQDAYLTFDVAYAQFKASTGKLFSDSLAIFYTEDCGQSYSLLWQRGGSSLATASPFNGFFVPSSSQWRNEKISLTPLNGKSSVNFVLVNKSGWGNALYLDNINILIPNRTSVPGSDFIVTPTSVCGGGSVSLSDRSSQYPTSWAWTITEKNNLTAVTSTLQYPDVTLRVSGIYNVKLVASNNIGIGTTNTQLSATKVGSNPIISLKASSTEVICRQLVNFTAYGGVKYLWYTDRSLDPITTSTGYSITDTLKYSSTYYVQGFDLNNCVGFDQIDISVSGSCSVTGINEVLDPNDIKIYPNPVENTVYVDINFTENSKILYFSLYSTQSAKVLQTTLQPGKNTISLTGIVPGMYLYSIGNNKFGKLIIE
jgi:PKD repeat protein